MVKILIVMDKLSLAEIIREIIQENVGPGPDDMVPVSQIYMDIYNNFLYPDSVQNFDPDKEFELHRYQERIKIGKRIFDTDFENNIEKYRDWKKGINLPKGRKYREFTKPFVSTEKRNKS